MARQVGADVDGGFGWRGEAEMRVERRNAVQLVHRLVQPLGEGGQFPLGDVAVPLLNRPEFFDDHAHLSRGGNLCALVQGTPGCSPLSLSNREKGNPGSPRAREVPLARPDLNPWLERMQSLPVTRLSSPCE